MTPLVVNKDIDPNNQIGCLHVMQTPPKKRLYCAVGMATRSD